MQNNICTSCEMMIMLSCLSRCCCDASCFDWWASFWFTADKTI